MSVELVKVVRRWKVELEDEEDKVFYAEEVFEDGKVKRYVIEAGNDWRVVNDKELEEKVWALVNEHKIDRLNMGGDK